MSKVKIICVATHRSGYIDALETGCNRANLELQLLGFGQKWTGFFMKFRLILDFLKSCDPDDIVFCVDAFDVLCLIASEEELRARFEAFNSDIVLGLDCKWKGFVNYAYKRIFGPARNSVWLNSGGYAGRVSALIHMLNLCKKMAKTNTDLEDDQRALMTAYRVHDNFFDEHSSVDYNQLLFHTVSPADTSRIAQQYKKGNQVAAFIHGPAQTPLNIIARAAKLPSCKAEPVAKSAYKYFWRNKLYLHARYFVPELLVIVVILILFSSKSN